MAEKGYILVKQFASLMNFPAFHSGVAFLRHIVQIFSYHGGNDLRNHLEVCLYMCVCVCLYTHIDFSHYKNIMLTGSFSSFC